MAELVATTAEPPRRQARRWSLGAALGAVLGLAPHLLHHVGLLAGTALVAGLGGTVLFGLVGLAAMTPMLLRLRRRFASWWAPAVALAAFAAMFAVSSLLIGPALRPDRPAHDPGPTAPTGEHTRHHPAGHRARRRKPPSPRSSTSRGRLRGGNCSSGHPW